MRSFTSLINQTLTQVGGEKYRPFMRLYGAWKDIVGPLLASRSHPWRFRDSVLYIAVQNNSWLQELYLRKADILKQCRQTIPEEIKEIIFIIRN
ncbi:MAG: DUF721 domain-containing protein [Candidatus Cloacimonadaceae bacterium]|nr:DUF721 domain-containing protein [Candidatus Cloacimonadota bacterium]MDX9949959.1 DUF721 domain-containing protein [Candidatus Syntrophosphaera sp.]NLN85536.1 DUF721 domain-containing protein [Candidatus Cloacimonadota bacterium]